MAALEFFVVCRSVSRDTFTDEMTLCGVLDEVELGTEGVAFLPTTVAVAVWNLGDAEDDVAQDRHARLVVTAPGQKPQNFDMQLAGTRKRYRAVFGVEGIPLTKPGKLTFEMTLDGCLPVHHTVFVTGAEKPASAVGEGITDAV